MREIIVRDYDPTLTESSGTTVTTAAPLGRSKVLAQSAPAATTATDVYTVPARTSTVVTGFTIANRGAATTFRVSVAPLGAVTANEQYLAYDTAIAANATVSMAATLMLSATDVVRVYAGSANLSFTLFGVETRV